VTTLLPKLIGPCDRVPGNFTVRTLSNNGDNMDSCEIPQATDIRGSIDSCLEMELQLKSLRLLICDLLKTNQELRAALEAKSDVQNNYG
jgi:hypothetical protein